MTYRAPRTEGGWLSKIQLRNASINWRVPGWYPTRSGPGTFLAFPGGRPTRPPPFPDKEATLHRKTSRATLFLFAVATAMGSTPAMAQVSSGREPGRAALLVEAGAQLTSLRSQSAVFLGASGRFEV